MVIARVGVAGTMAEYSAVQQAGQQYWRNTTGAAGIVGRADEDLRSGFGWRSLGGREGEGVAGIEAAEDLGAVAAGNDGPGSAGGP